jgi:protein O-GlcNAc transferase
MPAGTGNSLTETIERAIELQQSGDWSGASRLYDVILRTSREEFDSRHGEALHYLGVIEAQQGRLQEALRLIRHALTINPGDAKACSNLGNVLQELRRHEDALDSYDKALAIDPGDPVAWNSRGAVLNELKRYTQALASFDQALARDPGFAEAHNNRGNALLELRRHAEALACFDAALALRPDSAEAHSNRGNALLDLKRPEEALACHDRALALRPDAADFWNHRGNALVELRRYDVAATSYRKALALDPDCKYALGALCYSKRHACDWSGHEEECRRIVSGVRAGKNVIAPLAFLSISESAQDQLVCARLYAGRTYPASAAPVWTGERYRHDRIRLAYLSADFRPHPVSYLLAGIFELHDRSRFETVALSFGPDDSSEMGGRLKGAFERFIDVGGQSDLEVARLMRDLEIDIAVDLMGHTQSQRTGIFALRPCPVQVNFLGYPGTTGADYFDYIISDRVVIPEDHHAHYSEKVVYLPDTPQPNDRKRRIADRTPSRAEENLPDRGFVFCSFNHTYKFAPPTFDIWMRLLHKVEGSVLWLQHGNAAAAENLRREAAQRGIDGNRLVFASRTPLHEDHLARYRLADLFLDTLPYNAHTTASDALWAGLPVLTCLGTTFAGRVGASLLRAVGLPELIAPSLAEYEALALRLATEPGTLAALKATLARNREHCPLFDTDRFRRHIEAGYETMRDRYHRNEPPSGFAIVALP